MAAQYSSPKLAVQCGISLRQLQRYFHDKHKLKLHQWLTHIRLCHAQKLLLAGTEVKSVASLLGYKQRTHFSRQFKEYFGLSPKQYCRQQMYELPLTSLGQHNSELIQQGKQAMPS